LAVSAAGTVRDRWRLDPELLLGLAESRPVAEAPGLLAGLDPDLLTATQRIRLVRAWNRVTAHAQGRTLAALGAFAGPEPDPAGPGGIVGRDGRPDFLDCEAAIALQTGSV